MTRTEQKNQRAIRDYREKTGIRIYEMEEKEIPSRDRIVVCLVKGFLIFLTCYGLNMLVITSFDLPCSRVLIGFAAVLLSALASMFYYRKLFFNLGYILLFVIFLPLAIGLVTMANSGMNAITNIVMEAVDKKLNLGGVRVYQEMYADRNVTITCCLLLMLFLEICICNAVISEYMSGIVLFLLAFPFVQICIYLCDNNVRYIYVFLVMFPCIFCMIMKHCKRYRMGINLKHPGFTLKKKNISFLSMPAGRSFISLFAYGFLTLAGVFFLSFFLLRLFPYRARNNASAWKRSTDDAVSEFAMHGITAFFNSYETRGGIGNGRLGGIREVTYDFETDLLVQYVPYSTAPVYLSERKYSRYIKNTWKEMEINVNDFNGEKLSFEDSLRFATLEYSYLAERVNEGQSLSAYALMRIKAVDVDVQGEIIYPYYSGSGDNIKDSGVYDTFCRLNYQGSGTIDYSYHNHLYYPLLAENIALQADQTDYYHKAYKKYVYDNCTSVPEDLRDLLKQICDEEGFHGTPMQIVVQIQRYFRDNFQYTLAPGKTPRNRDFVAYFLTKQKKGYCVYFATAGALLLRQMGIPTRYVEGYCIDIETAADASDIVEGEDYRDWYDGDNLLISDTDDAYVIEVAVNDSKAHAWAEIYIDGFGWIPVELTTGSQSESSDGQGFWSNFGRYLSGDGGEAPMQVLTAQATRLGIGLLYIVLIALVLFILYLIIRTIIRKVRLYCIPNNKRLSNQYVLLNKLLNRYYLDKQINVFHNMSVDFGLELGLPESELNEFASLTERASYGGKPLNKAELSRATTLFRKYVKALRKKVKGLRKVSLWIQS